MEEYSSHFIGAAPKRYYKERIGAYRWLRLTAYRYAILLHRRDSLRTLKPNHLPKTSVASP